MREKLLLYEAMTGTSSITRMKIYGGRSDVTVVISVESEVLVAVLMKIKSSGMLHRVDW
jgi:hypothetical protein